MKSKNIAKREQMLLFGATDMQRAVAAAEAIQREYESTTPVIPLIEALQTALVVCYWRPFSQKNTAGHLTDRDALDRDLHRDMKTLRDQVHAHIDVASGRTAGVTPVPISSDLTGFAFGESSWDGFPDEWLPRFIEVATRQMDDFRIKALELSP